MRVLMFQGRFAELIVSGQKRQTIRRFGKRNPQVGQTLSLRRWSGKAYRSQQETLKSVLCTEVHQVSIDEQELVLGGKVLNSRERESLALADGFALYVEMVEWFRDVHGLPFDGLLIAWDSNHDGSSKKS